jgi:hypothetical protein
LILWIDRQFSLLRTTEYFEIQPIVCAADASNHGCLKQPKAPSFDWKGTNRKGKPMSIFKKSMMLASAGLVMSSSLVFAQAAVGAAMSTEPAVQTGRSAYAPRQVYRNDRALRLNGTRQDSRGAAIDVVPAPTGD